MIFEGIIIDGKTYGTERCAYNGGPCERCAFYDAKKPSHDRCAIAEFILCPLMGDEYFVEKKGDAK